MDISREIEMLGEKLSSEPDNIELLLARALLHYRLMRLDKALNDLYHIQELDPNHGEAAAYVEAINEIINFRHFRMFDA